MEFKEFLDKSLIWLYLVFVFTYYYILWFLKFVYNKTKSLETLHDKESEVELKERW